MGRSDGGPAGEGPEPTEESPGVSRRSFLRASVLGGSFVAVPGLLSACSSSKKTAAAPSSTAPAPSASSSGAAPSSAAASGSTAASGGPVGANDTLRALFPMGKNDGAGMKFTNGMLLAMTGTGAFYGRVMSRGAQLAAKQIAAMGGPTFDIQIADHQSGNVQAGVTGTRRLIQQNKIETLQTSYGAVTVAIIPLIQSGKVMTLNGGGPDPSQVGKDWLYMTRMFAGDDQAAGGCAWLAQTFPSAIRLAVVGTTENATESQTQIIPTMWPKLGGGRTVVVQDTTESGATSYAQTVARVQAAKADAVFTFNTGNDHGYLLKDLRDGGFKGPVLGIEYSTDAAKIAGAAYDTYFFTADFFDVGSQNPFAKQFVEAHTAEYGVAPELYGANYYEEVFMIWTLIRNALAAGADPHQSSSLLAAMNAGPKFLSVYGGSAAGPGQLVINADHTTVKPQGVYQVTASGPVLLESTQKIDLAADPKTALLKKVADPAPTG